MYECGERRTKMTDSKEEVKRYDLGETPDQPGRSSSDLLVLVLNSVDFEENTITLQATNQIMQKGFHAGRVRVDLSDVQSLVLKY